MADAHSGGWTNYLARLAAVAEGRDPGPDPLAAERVPAACDLGRGTEPARPSRRRTILEARHSAPRAGRRHALDDDGLAVPSPRRGFFASCDHRTGQPVIKLTEERVTALINAGRAEPFVPSGRPFREWVSIPHRFSRSWAALLDEALRCSAERGRGENTRGGRRREPTHSMQRPSRTRSRAEYRTRTSGGERAAQPRRAVLLHKDKRPLCYFHDDHNGDGRTSLWCPTPPGVQQELVSAEPQRFFKPPTSHAEPSRAGSASTSTPSVRTKSTGTKSPRSSKTPTETSHPRRSSPNSPSRSKRTALCAVVELVPRRAFGSVFRNGSPTISRATSPSVSWVYDAASGRSQSHPARSHNPAER